MDRLISKLQYKTFEPGEFAGVLERSYGELIELIEHFPWEAERENIKVALTNPSVTVERGDDSYLKLAVYFTNKYVLYYLHEGKTLYSKSFLHLDEAFSYIRSYFESPVFDHSGFKKETTWLQKPLNHFQTKDFHYSISARRVRNYFLRTTAPYLLLSCIIITYFILHSPVSIGIIIFFGLAMLIMGGFINLVIFLQYYFYSRYKVLVISRGKPDFYFGNKDQPVRYDKSDVFELVTTRIDTTRSPFRGFAIVTLRLKDGHEIKIPNMIIPYDELEDKFPGTTLLHDSGLPGLGSNFGN